MIDEAFITNYIRETFEDVETVENSGDTFFFNDPERMFPFATIVASDAYDQFSNLDREGVFRFNLSVGKEAFQKLFGTGYIEDGDYDFAAIDTILPHPVYGKLRWICVLNPSEETFETIKPMLAEAYKLSAERVARRTAKSK